MMNYVQTQMPLEVDEAVFFYITPSTNILYVSKKLLKWKKNIGNTVYKIQFFLYNCN